MTEVRAFAPAWHAALEGPRAQAILWVDAHRSLIPAASLRQLSAAELVDAMTLAFVVLLVMLALWIPLRAFRSTSVSTPSKTSAQARTHTRKPGPRTVVLVGPSDAGKTSLFSALVYGSVPQTHTSQVDATGWTVLGQPDPPALLGEKAPVPQSTAVRLIDTPGHPRLRSRAHDFLAQADAVVFCVDATTAARSANATAAAAPGTPFADTVDFFHSTLTALATQRLRDETSTKTTPPSLMILFTRSDMSPLLSAGATDDEQLSKRRTQLLQRATAGFEAELAWRRAALQVGRRSGALGSAGLSKLSGIDEIQSGEDASQSLWSRIRSFLGLTSSSTPAVVAEEEQDEFDYIDWHASQRASSGATSVAGRVGLDQLDPDVVAGGAAQWGLISLGKDRSWSGKVEGKDVHDLRVFLTGL